MNSRKSVMDEIWRSIEIHYNRFYYHDSLLGNISEQPVFIHLTNFNPIIP